MNRVTSVRLANGETIELPEPAWCVGRHEDGLDLVDVRHDGPEVALAVSTGSGEVDVLEAGLCQNPFSSRLEDRAPAVTVLLEGGYRRFDPLGLRALSLGLVAHAERLQVLAYELERLRAEGSQ